MNTLEKAWQEMTGAEQFAYEEVSKEKIAFVMAYAAIAQAEQLKRIADALYSGEGSPLSLALADLVKLIHAQVAANGPV